MTDTSRCANCRGHFVTTFAIELTDKPGTPPPRGKPATTTVHVCRRCYKIAGYGESK